jgi:tripartite-type tricarboxylate transporter receptor subunit TctC
MKRFSRVLIVIAVFIALTAACSFAAFPTKNLNGIIQWGAGGGTDGVFRSLVPHVEPILGRTIVLTNRTGATGAIATTFVHAQAADGYHLLMAAENPATYRILGLSSLSFHDFEPILIAAQGTVVIAGNPNTPYKTMKDFVEAAKAGTRINMATSGTGGLPYVASAMMRTIHGVDFNFIQFDGDGPGATAVMGGHADVMPLALSTAAENIRSGRLHGLAVLRTERVPQLPDVPAITEIYPEYAKYLPWGPFYGVFVKKGTPEAAIVTLTEAFKKASEEPRFQEFMTNFGGINVGLTGDAAREFLRQFESTANWLIYEAGGTTTSPEEFGIPKP